MAIPEVARLEIPARLVPGTCCAAFGSIMKTAGALIDPKQISDINALEDSSPIDSNQLKGSW